MVLKDRKRLPYSCFDEHNYCWRYKSLPNCFRRKHLSAHAMVIFPSNYFTFARVQPTSQATLLWHFPNCTCNSTCKVWSWINESTYNIHTYKQACDDTKAESSLTYPGTRVVASYPQLSQKQDVTASWQWAQLSCFTDGWPYPGSRWTRCGRLKDSRCSTKGTLLEGVGGRVNGADFRCTKSRERATAVYLWE